MPSSVASTMAVAWLLASLYVSSEKGAMPSCRWHDAHAVKRIGATSRVKVTRRWSADTLLPLGNGANPTRDRLSATTAIAQAAAGCSVMSQPFRAQ